MKNVLILLISSFVFSSCVSGFKSGDRSPQQVGGEVEFANFEPKKSDPIDPSKCFPKHSGAISIKLNDQRDEPVYLQLARKHSHYVEPYSFHYWDQGTLPNQVFNGQFSSKTKKVVIKLANTSKDFSAIVTPLLFSGSSLPVGSLEASIIQGDQVIYTDKMKQNGVVWLSHFRINCDN